MKEVKTDPFQENAFGHPLGYKSILEKNLQPVWVIVVGKNGPSSSWALVAVRKKEKQVQLIFPNLQVVVAPLQPNFHLFLADKGVLVFENQVSTSSNPYVKYS